MKKFMKKTEGFTLVELIVVIAILGILAGVGTVGYSGYVKKANMAADQQLLAGVKNTLELSLLSKPGNTVKNGVIVLSKDADAKVEIVGENNDETKTFLENAMKAAFGDAWASVCKLKYDSWTGDAANYNESSYAGEEDDLMGKVNNITETVSEFFKTERKNTPQIMLDYLEKNNISMEDNVGTANAMALLIADGYEIKLASGETVAQKVSNTFASLSGGGVDLPDLGDSIEATFAEAYKVNMSNRNDPNYHMVTMSTAAAMYAYAEAYATYAKNEKGDSAARIRMDNLNDWMETNTTASAGAIYGKVLMEIGALFDEASKSSTGKSYLAPREGDKKAQAAIDAEGLSTVMLTLGKNADTLVESAAENEGFYTDGTLMKLFNNYQALAAKGGEGSVMLMLGENGVITCDPAQILN